MNFLGCIMMKDNLILTKITEIKRNTDKQQSICQWIVEQGQSRMIKVK